MLYLISAIAYCEQLIAVRDRKPGSMLENINTALFALTNATPASPPWIIELATLVARDIILLIPLLTIALWLWLPHLRQLVFKITLALVISLTLSALFGVLFPHERPFAAGTGYQFLHHAPDNSFPSNHGTISFTFALAFLFWHRLWSGGVLIAIAIAIAWSRIYLGVHWPLDMLGGLLTGLCSCLSTRLLWPVCGSALYSSLQNLYRSCFSSLIRKGWIRD